jgi:hypothetical protein
LHSSDGTKVNEATDFAVVLLIEQQPSLYDKIHPEGWNGLDYVWERMSHDMKEPGIF